MTSQFLYTIRPTREGFLIESTPEENRIVDEHFAYLKALIEGGVVLLAGRTLNTDSSSLGIVIFEAEAAANEIMRSDPAVRASVLQATLFPHRVALASPGVLPM